MPAKFSRGKPSNTPAILEHLKTLEPGAMFTVVELMEQLPGMTSGSISGFLYTCAKHGMLERAGFRARDGGSGRASLVYKVLDPTIEVPTGRHASNGGAVGRANPHGGYPHQPRLDLPGDEVVAASLVGLPHRNKKRKDSRLTVKAVVDKLLTLASEIEGMTPDLAGVPTDALLAELQRRIL